MPREDAKLFALLAVFSCWIGGWTYWSMGTPPEALARTAAPTMEAPPDAVVAEVPPPPCAEPCDGPSMVWGDSMAWAWSGLAAVSNSHPSCPPLRGYPKGDQWPFQRTCREFNNRTLVKANRSDRVVLAALWLHYPLEDVRLGLSATLDALDSDVVIVGPTPILRDRISKCLRMAVEDCAVPRAEFDAQAEPMRRVLRALATEHGARYVDPVDFFCNGERCPALRDGMPLYWDDRHVSVSAVHGFKESLRLKL